MVLERNIKIIHPQFGELLNDFYNDEVQFKLFLQMVHSCVELKQDLSFSESIVTDFDVSF